MQDFNKLEIALRSLEIVAIALVYVITARLGQTFAIEPGNVTPVWLPSGIMFALVILRGIHLWPAIFLGAMFGNSWAYADFSTLASAFATVTSASANGLGDTLCVVGSVLLLKHFIDTKTLFMRIRSFGYFILFAVVLGPLVSALFGVTALFLNGFLDSGYYLMTLSTWWIGDGVGVLLIAPAILIFAYHNTEPELKARQVELIIFSAVVLLTTWFLFNPDFLSPPIPNTIYLMVPILIWSVFRFGLRVTFICSLYLAAISIIATSQNLGPFLESSEYLSIVSLQMYIVIVTTSIFMAGSLIAEREQLVMQLRTRASRDPLTGMHNRQYFTEQLEREINRQKRYNTPLCLIMFDIDNFKSINDNYGHAVGDQVLQQVSALISKELREMDTLARWGGEEFLIMMPETHSEGGCIFAERIRALVETTSFVGNETITISVGVVERDRDVDRDKLIKALDDAMYSSKEQGKNRVEYLSLQ